MWQPLETAPQDKEVLGLWGNDYCILRCSSGDWFADYEWKVYPSSSSSPCLWQPLPERPMENSEAQPGEIGN